MGEGADDVPEGDPFTEPQVESILFDPWDVSEIQDFSEIFSIDRNPNVTSFAFNPSISGWDVSSATSMSRMFYGAESFDQDVSRWDHSTVKTFRDKFNGKGVF